MCSETTPRNLIILVNPRALDPRDMVEIGRRVAAMDRSLRVVIGTPLDDDGILPEDRWQYPTLTVSLCRPGRFRPRRGSLLHNMRTPKWQQQVRMRAAGIRVPRTAIYDPSMTLSPEDWGSHVIVKASRTEDSSRGLTGLLVSTAALMARRGLPGHVTDLLETGDAMVQQYIPTGNHPTSYRVGTFLGRAIHMMRKSSSHPAPDLNGVTWATADSNHEDTSSALPAGRALVEDPEVKAFGLQVAAAFPELPLLGIDILRHAATGELHALEINAGGNTWQFSSPHAAAGRAIIGKEERVRQFDAWRTCAERLVEVTRAQAA